MARAMVKCLYCGLMFDRNSEDFKKPSVRRYAHLACYEKHFNKSEDQIPEEIWFYLTKELKMTCDFQNIERQRKMYIEEKNFTNEGILNALKYYYEIKKGSVEKSHNRIGIVPFIYDQAQEYFKDLEQKKKRIGKEIGAQIDTEKLLIKITKGEKKKQKDYIDLDKIGG